MRSQILMHLAIVIAFTSNQASSALNITHYPLPKIQGTRFVAHRRRGFNKLIHNWPALITVFDNARAAPGYRGETKAKIIGIANKLHDYSFLCKVAAYLDFLDALSPLSLIFERKLLMTYEVNPAVEETIDNLERKAEETEDEVIGSYLRKFRIIDQDGLVTVEGQYPKAGHERRKPGNREYLDVELPNMNKVGHEEVLNALELIKYGANVVVPLIRDRFSSFTTDIFKEMAWLDPQYWTGEKGYAEHDINALICAFKIPLEAAGFESKKVLGEWKSVQHMVNTFYRNVSAEKVWEKILIYKKKEFPNLLLLVELVMCMSSSNSSVERVFSILTILLSDRRLKMNHSTMEDCIIISGNDALWSDKERGDIVKAAVEKYLMKRRVKRMAKDKPTPIEVESSAEEDESDDSSSSSDEESVGYFAESEEDIVTSDFDE